ncbi:MAG: hypothetical protein HUU35_10155, partial [Armatimonadetes bacterium]|nr:hypothetical protein [Armatimonadota bacterium]
MLALALGGVDPALLTAFALTLALAAVVPDDAGTPAPLGAGNERDLARLPIENPYPVLRVGPNDQLLYANDPAREILALGERTDLGALPPPLLAALREVGESRLPRFVELPLAARVFAFTVVAGHEPGIANIYGVDVTSRVAAEARSAQLNRFLRTMLACQGAIGRANTEQELFRSVCDAVARGDRRAWVALRSAEAPGWRCIAEGGQPAGGAPTL